MIIYDDDIIDDHDKEDNDNDNVPKFKDPDVHIVETAVDKRTMVSIAISILKRQLVYIYRAEASQNTYCCVKAALKKMLLVCSPAM